MNTQQEKENSEKPERDFTMTKHDALVYALNTVIKCNDNPDVCEVLTTMIAQLSKPKVKRADARATLMAQVLPILRDGLSNYPDVGQTAKELYKGNRDVLPADFTVNKVQYILLHEMKDEVVKTEAKGKPNIYMLKG